MTRLALWTAAAALCVLGAACGDDGGHRVKDDAARPIDAAVVIDARPVDAAPPLPAYEITAGAKALTGTSHKADVQIGHAMSQAPVTGNGRTAQGNAAVKP